MKARSLAVEIIKTGRRLWLTAGLDPMEDDINVDGFMLVKAEVSKVTLEVQGYTQTEVLLERN